MKINAIRIKNLASLEGITEIDFTAEPLASAGIFAITGPTGAGKSTLLDALCLALYGKTPRYLQAKEMGIEIHDVQGSTMSQGDVRGILRDGSFEGFAEVDFVGTDGQNYRSTWSVRRARNKADGSLQADTISLKNTSANIDLPGKKAEIFKEIERLVGLNFEQFTRSVLLAQGDFTAFMKASKDEKSSLLEKLTGTHIYSEISKKIFEKYKSQEQILRELNIRRDGIVTLSEAELLEIGEEEKILNIQIIELSAEIEIVSKEINWHEQFSLLSISKEAATTNLEKANEILAQSEARKDKLEQVERAQTTRTWNDSFLYNQAQLLAQKTNLEHLETKMGMLLLQKDKLNGELKIEELNSSATIRDQKEALPKLDEAKKLDTLIFEKHKQRDLAKSEETVAKLKFDSQQKQVLENENQIEKFSEEISRIEGWQTKFFDKKPIAENKDIIISKLNDAENYSITLKSATIEKEILAGRIAVNKIEIEAELVIYEIHEKQLEIQQKVVETISTVVLLIPIEKLNLEKEETEFLLNTTHEALSIWNVLFTQNSELQRLLQKQTDDQTAVFQKKRSLERLKKQLENSLISKQTSEQLLQKSRLSASENVETLREKLLDDEPCLVCGSLDHPYKVYNPQLEKVLSMLEESHLQNEKAYLSTFDENSRLEQECINLNQGIEERNAEINYKKVVAENKNQQWESNPIFKECQELDNSLKSNWLEEKIIHLKRILSDFLIKIKAHSVQKEEVESAKVQVEIVKEKRDACSAKIMELKSEFALYNEKLEAQSKIIFQYDKLLEEIINNISIYFVGSNWRQNWMDNPTDFLNFIISFSQEWNANEQRLDHNKNQYATTLATLVQLKSRLNDVEEEFSKKSKAYSALQESFIKLRLDRNSIFEGQSAEVLEQQFANAVQEAQKKIDGIKILINQNNIDSATSEAQQKEIKISVLRIELEIENNTTKIQDWLSEYKQKFQKHLSSLELNELLRFSVDWIENERKVLNGFEEQRTKTTSILQERTQLLEKHIEKRSSERGLEELQLLFADTKSKNQFSTQAKANLGFRIKEDEANKAKIGDLLNEISIQFKIYDNWSRLNEVIGSADGKKFRQIAQEHTLEVLLSYANIHLQVLTSRYRIERIPNTLALQVVDLDMGEEIRTVYSLSGGESFLVSLALALGLASLSSSKMKVESLFIDEGFGSLDPNTLNVAMDALERLHNQGRKVGVISHVQEMTERIPVQIKVSKKASGRSMVEILGV